MGDVCRRFLKNLKTLAEPTAVFLGRKIVKLDSQYIIIISVTFYHHDTGVLIIPPVKGPPPVGDGYGEIIYYLLSPSFSGLR